LAAALALEGLSDVCLIAVGSDGTDGPTDAAGGVVDGDSVAVMRQNGIDPTEALEQNDSYRALSACDGLVITGPTGTNVNDVAILLIEG
jgi:hydroxypyruvate reductase